MRKKLGCRARRIERIRAAMPLTEELQAHGKECDATWWARHDSREDPQLWYVTPFSVNGRGGEPLEQSNYEVAQRLIEEAAGMEIDYRVDLWPGGSINTIIVRADDALAIRMVERLVDALRDYPILDEEHYSECVWEENHPSANECYGDDDCSCEVGERKRQVKKHSCELEFVVTLYASNEKEEGSEIWLRGIDEDQFWCGFCEEWQDWTDTMNDVYFDRLVSQKYMAILKDARDKARKGETNLI